MFSIVQLTNQTHCISKAVTLESFWERVQVCNWMICSLRIASGSPETYIEKFLLLFACRGKFVHSKWCSKLLSYFSLTGIQEQIFPLQGYYAQLTDFFPPLFFILQLGSTLFKTSLMPYSACQLGKTGSSFFVQHLELLISPNIIFSFLNKRQIKYCSITSRTPGQRTVMSVFLLHDFK